MPMTFKLRELLLSSSVALSLCGAATMASAAEPAVLGQLNGMAVTTDDVSADLQRVPLQQRPQVASKPNNIQQLTSNLLLRRAFAAEAEKAGLDKDPIVAAALRQARDRVLSEVRLAQFDKEHAPNEQAIDSYAQSKYKAEPQRFSAPAQTRARHILIGRDVEGGQAKAEKLLHDLQNGADFEALARDNSSDPGSAAKGGDLGFFAAGRMVPQFDAAVNELKQPGALSPVVETQFGWHIIRLEERKEAGVRSYEEVREQLHAEARQQMLNQQRTTKADAFKQQMKLNAEAAEAFAKTQEAKQ